MIESIRLRNFQIHKDLTVAFDPHLTTIVGSSDVGKSSIVRALGWVCLNRPNGDAFIKDGSSFASVRLKVDGQTVIRKKGKANVYQLNKKEFRAFGQSIVPEDIQKLLNVTSTNIQEQLDPHFWLTDSPGQVSRNLNQIINLEVIDSTLANVASELRKARAVVEVTNTRLKAAKDRRKQLKWVKDLSADLSELEGLEEKYVDLNQRAGELATTVDTGSVLELLNDRLADVLKHGEKATQLGKQVQDGRVRISSLRAILQKASELKSLVDSPLPNISKLEAVRQNADEVAEKRRRLETIVTQIKEQEDSLCQARVSLKRVEKEIAQETDGRCPLCNQKASLSEFSSQTYTSDSNPPLRDRTSLTGSKRKQDISVK